MFFLSVVMQVIYPLNAAENQSNSFDGLSILFEVCKNNPENSLLLLS